MNKTTKIISAIVAVLIVIGTITIAVSRAREQKAVVVDQPARVINIGVVAPLSGPAAVYGGQMQSILDYELARVNAKYASQKLSFKLLYEDGKCNGTDAVDAFQKLTDIDGVKFVLGGFCSTESLAIAPIAQQKQILAFGLSSSPKVDHAGTYTYSLGFKDDNTGKALAKAMSKYNKVAIITEQNDYNTALREVVVSELKNYPNVTIVADESFTKGGSDFRNVLEKVKQAKPDAVFLNPNAGATAKGLIKQLAEIKDWNGYQLFGNLSYMPTDAIAVAPKTLEGMVIADAAKITDPKFVELQKQIEAAKGNVSDSGTYYVAAIVDTLDIYADLIAKYGENSTAVRDGLASGSFNGYTDNNIRFENSSFPKVAGGLYIIKNGAAEYQQ